MPDDKMPSDDEIHASIEAFMHRRQYDNFDRATLGCISDEKLETAIHDYVCNLIGTDWCDEEAVVRQLSPGFRAIYSTLRVEAEVDNGGFNQYFWNSEGKLADLAVEGFQHIGAPEYAELMRRAITAWRNEQRNIEPLRELNTLEAFSESYEHSKLSGLDDEFYRLAEVSDLSKLRVSFIRSHVEEFITV